jgi:hypothetical protein
MFTTPRVPARLASITLKTVDVGDEKKRLVECRFEIAPLSYDLARELGHSIAAHLFTVIPAETPFDTETYMPNADVEDITFRPRTDALYDVELFTADDDALPPSVCIIDALAHRLRVKRDKKAPMFESSFLCTFELPIAKDTYSLLHLFDEVIYVTMFERQPKETEPTLNFDGVGSV